MWLVSISYVISFFHSPNMPTNANINPTVTTPLVDNVTAFLQCIFDIPLSPKVMTIFLKYFSHVTSLDHTCGLLHAYFLLDDNSTGAVIQPFGTLNSADNFILNFLPMVPMQQNPRVLHLGLTQYYDSDHNNPSSNNASNTSIPPTFPSEPKLPDAADFFHRMHHSPPTFLHLLTTQFPLDMITSQTFMPLPRQTARNSQTSFPMALTSIPIQNGRFIPAPDFFWIHLFFSNDKR